ncbi:hypothetical protein [Kutzneria albida]|nr:hypothetical protein [Kutzneria albida]
MDDSDARRSRVHTSTATAAEAAAMRVEMVEFLAVVVGMDRVGGGNNPVAAALMNQGVEHVHAALRALTVTLGQLCRTGAMDLRARVARMYPALRGQPTAQGMRDELKGLSLPQLAMRWRDHEDPPGDDGEEFLAWVGVRLAVLEILDDRLLAHRKTWDGPISRARAGRKLMIKADNKPSLPQILCEEVGIED